MERVFIKIFNHGGIYFIINYIFYQPINMPRGRGKSTAFSKINLYLVVNRKGRKAKKEGKGYAARREERAAI